MESLELKHIKGYLDTKLKGIDEQGNQVEIVGVKNETYFINSGNTYAYGDIQSLKTILRPLSDLRKDEFFDLYMDLCESLEMVNCANLLLALEKEYYYTIDIQKYHILEDWMNKNHFDWKHNLIEKGLAIDINNLNTNENEK